MATGTRLEGEGERPLHGAWNMAQSIDEWAIPAKDLDDKALAGQLRCCRDRFNQLASVASKRGIMVETKLRVDGGPPQSPVDRVQFDGMRIIKQI